MIPFFKAIIRGGAAGDLFAVPVMVDGHTRRDGTYVLPHASIRYKRREPPAKKPEPAAPTPQLSLFDHQHQPPEPEPERDNSPPAIVQPEEKAAEPPKEEAKPDLLTADRATYERALYDAAMARLEAGGSFSVGTSTRTVRFTRPGHGQGLRFHGGRIQIGQGKSWIDLGPIGQAIDSLAGSLGMPTSWDRTKAKAEADAANPEARDARHAAAAAAMEPLFAERERIRAMEDSRERDNLRKDVDRRLHAEARKHDVFLRDVEEWREEHPPAVDESAGNSGSVAEQTAQPEVEPAAPAGQETAASAPRFERFGDAANAFGGEPFSAQDVADRLEGGYADDVLDQLHARPDDFALLTDGRWQAMPHYLGREDRAEEVARLADAVAADHPEEHKARWRQQLHRLAETMAMAPKARALTPAPEPDDLDPSSPNYRYRDTGYIAGSRKEMAAESIRAAARSGARVRKTDVDWDELEQNPRQAAELITKANLFGDVDWQAMQAAGMDPGAGFLISRVYASVGAKPEESNPQGRQDYAAALDSLRDRMEQARTVDDVARILSEIKDERDGLTLTAAEAEAYNVLTEAWREAGAEVQAIDKRAEALAREATNAESHASRLSWDLKKRRDRKWRVDPAQEAELAKLQEAATALRETAAAFRRDHGMIPTTTESNTATSRSTTFHYPYREKWKKLSAMRTAFMNGVVARNRGENPLTRAWHSLGPSFQAVVDYRGAKGSDAFGKHYATARAGRIKDWEWAEKKQAPRGSTERGTAFQLQVADGHERIGGRAPGVDSTSALKRAFGLRDVQSGHWVLEDPNSAKFHTEAAAGAFADLADLIGVPDEQVSLNGRLGLAFGARGAGTRTGKAHYEPVQRVINITKMAGGGSLGHEWFHFIDNLMPEVESGREGAADRFATEGATEGVHDDVRRAFEDLTAAMMEGPHRQIERMSYTSADARWAASNLDGYQSGSTRAAIRNAATMQEAVDAVAQLYERGAFGPVDKPKTKSRYQDWRKLALIWHAERERKAAGVPDDAPRIASFEKGRGTSSFVQGATELDKGAAGKYWSQPKELAARAFSAWCEDRLEAMGRRNTYLAAHANNDHPAYKMMGARPFPEGEERARINAAFDRLFSVLRERGSLAKALAALASRAPAPAAPAPSSPAGS